MRTVNSDPTDVKAYLMLHKLLICQAVIIYSNKSWGRARILLFIFNKVNILQALHALQVLQAKK